MRGWTGVVGLGLLLLAACGDSQGEGTGGGGTSGTGGGGASGIGGANVGGDGMGGTPIGGGAGVGGSAPHEAATVEAGCVEAMTVDGSLADWGDPSVEQAVEKVTTGLPNGTTASFQAGWSADALWVAIEVVDPAIFVDSGEDVWLDDSVEIYLDLAHDHNERYGSDDYQFILTFGGPLWETGGRTDGVEFATTATAEGWVAEVSIPWAAVGAPVGFAGADQQIGFDVGINIDQDGGDRDGQLMWNGTFNNYQDPREFGHLLMTCVSTP